MTAIALPRPRRRRSKPAQLAKGVAKTWTSMKVGSTVARTAKKGVKAWGKFKVVKFVGRRGAKLLLVPLAAGGGVGARPGEGPLGGGGGRGAAAPARGPPAAQAAVAARAQSSVFCMPASR